MNDLSIRAIIFAAKSFVLLILTGIIASFFFLFAEITTIPVTYDSKYITQKDYWQYIPSTGSKGSYRPGYWVYVISSTNKITKAKTLFGLGWDTQIVKTVSLNIDYNRRQYTENTSAKISLKQFRSDYGIEAVERLNKKGFSTSLNCENGDLIIKW